tara:strand:- start:618 stop:1085 length:468 start_codon:yes stop_codon:yes gene_type:complete
MNYILVSSDGFTDSGAALSAYNICLARIRRGRWPMYSNTAHNKRIKSNDQFIIYVAGKKVNKQNFILSFKAKKIITKKIEMLNVDHAILKLTNPHPDKEIVFEPKEINNLLPIHSCLDMLDHTKNRKSVKWGSLMMGGAKSITEHDFKFIASKLK